MPAFEGLLPQKHNRIVQKLLFELATWHGLAKLRLHTESTLTDLENSATRLGNILRKFKTDVCSAYITRDLPSEEAARGRRQAAKAKKVAEGPQPTAVVTKSVTKKSKLRIFNMETYKLHGLPDYPTTIRAFGVTENTSTKNVCSFLLDSKTLIFLMLPQGEGEHKRSKQFYPRVRKGDHVRGIARHVYRERLLFQVHEAMKKRHLDQKRHVEEGQDVNMLNIPLGEQEILDPTPPELHHHISKDVRHKVDVLKWLAQNRADPALKVRSLFY